TPREEDALNKGKEALAAQSAILRSTFDIAVAPIKEAILHLDYDFAFREIRRTSAYGQVLIAPLLEELGFVFQASGRFELARETFQELLRLGLPQYRPITYVLAEALGNIGFYPLLNMLEKIPDGAAPLIKERYLGEMVYIKGGNFMMGSEVNDHLIKQIMSSEISYILDFEKPTHLVTLNGFFLQKTPVTYWQYSLFMQREGLQMEKPHWGWKGDNPAVYVSWEDAIRYCNWRSTQEGLLPAYSTEGATARADRQSNGYRLPSEAEWEYAARGGPNQQPFRYSGSDDPDLVGWHRKGNAKKQDFSTKAVGLKLPNALGLYDMSGNVYEWCEDDWHDNYNKDLNDGCAWVDMPRGSSRVCRGGSWERHAVFCRVAHRFYFRPDSREACLGFRAAFVPPSGG
ncbi:MAG: formylglycine-generating enzyme family protein, partial [Saprospiraceae bacterium]